MGEVVGPLSAEAAVHLGLRPGIPVTQGGPDAYVGMVGLGYVVDDCSVVVAQYLLLSNYCSL